MAAVTLPLSCRISSSLNGISDLGFYIKMGKINILAFPCKRNQRSVIHIRDKPDESKLFDCKMKFEIKFLILVSRLIRSIKLLFKFGNALIQFTDPAPDFGAFQLSAGRLQNLNNRFNEIGNLFF